MMRFNGETWDIPDAVRHFQRYTSEQRMNMAASHRMGHRQKHRVGEYFWTHEFCPGVAFDTRKAARIAALQTLGVPA